MHDKIVDFDWPERPCKFIYGQERWKDVYCGGGIERLYIKYPGPHLYQDIFRFVYAPLNKRYGYISNRFYFHRASGIWSMLNPFPWRALGNGFIVRDYALMYAGVHIPPWAGGRINILKVRLHEEVREPYASELYCKYFDKCLRE